MSYFVEKWETHEYPSHWSHVEQFTLVSEAIDYVKKQDNPSNFRVIEVLWEIN